MNLPFADSYDPPAVEAAWYTWWEKQGFFKPEYGGHAPDNEKFVMVIPPPNVTGSLHLGHALTNSVQDSLVRWHRMLGHTTLWVPGTDHAGISTQAVVEKRLWRDKQQTRYDLGREAFVAEVWKWKNFYRDRIVDQLKRLGSSLDWSREAFTMDQNLSRAVLEAFVQMYDSGLIYREKRMVNWCCALKTAISDEEVEPLELPETKKLRVPGHGENAYEFGAIWEFAYKVEGTDEDLVVATTRPETMLADTAVAVHPDDERYKHLHGKKVVHPFHGTLIPIICDPILVILNFGTGAVKVTPGHDPNDFECGVRNKLPMPELFTDSGEINEQGGPLFQGMKRFDARNAVLEKLKEKRLFRGVKPNVMTIGQCAKTKDIIEPRLKPMWWVRCSEMAKRAQAARESGELIIVPEQHNDTWDNWMKGIRDWCISRQLFWGHRIPAYLVTVAGQPLPDSSSGANWVVGRTYEEAIAAAKVKFPNMKAEDLVLEQDPDVLDTWFSSGLFPFSVFGWPEKTPDFSKFYPTTFLETGSDIIFFWVARMVFMGQQLTGKLPFNQVFLHAMVRDAHGRKMSKTLGNVVDPIDVIEGITLDNLHKKLLEGNLDPKEVAKATEGQKADFPNGIAECGTDALRFALCAYTAQGRDINLDIKRVEGYRAFCNKIWNATRFALKKLEGDFTPAEHQAHHPKVSKIDQWVLSRLAEFVENVNGGFRQLNFSKATTACYNFWMYDLCDNYLEMSKPIFSSEASSGDKHASQETLYTCLDMGLRLLHPFMPFLTEELYQRLPRRPNSGYPSIMVCPYPTAKDTHQWSNQIVEEEVKHAQDVARSIRGILSSYNVAPSKRPKVYVNAKTSEMFETLQPFTDVIKSLAFAGSVILQHNSPAPTDGCAVNVVSPVCEVFVDLRDLIDFATEIKRLETKREGLSSQRENLLKKVNQPSYSKVPENVRNDNSQKLAQIESEIAATNTAIEGFNKLKK
eukprot:Phypoly_transcript_01455.p1 GENE.Phypoly_transcript_01455~~Phypoly_transcript_01455.p1  ORF type:complete len:1115 (+),score=189.55 Phypoly_transcript_01455:428-3346(+)